MDRYANTFGHTPAVQMFERADVYGIAHDPSRAAQRPVRLGVIGAGGVTQAKYLPAVTRLRTLWEPVRVAAVADPDSTQAAKLQEIYGLRWYSDHREMLAAEELDGVLVASPDRLHATHAADALARGIPTLVEKPFTASLVDAGRLCDQAEAAGVPLLAVANLRFNPAHQRARELIERGEIPDPGLFIAKMTIGYSYVDLLEDATVHLFDLARFYMGDVATVTAKADRTAGWAGYPFSHGGLMLGFASGGVGMLATSSRALSLKPWHRVEVFGSGAWLAVDDLYELTIYDDEIGPTKSWRPVPTNTLLFDEELGGHMGMVQHFVDVVRGTAAPLVTGRDGYRSCELVAAAHIAMTSGTEVSLPLDPEFADREVSRIRSNRELPISEERDRV
jgi:predicted dehydrogenase